VPEDSAAEVGDVVGALLERGPFNAMNLSCSR
jgi:hypothetical protein